MSLFPPATFPPNNAHQLPPPSASTSYVSQSSVRSNVAFVVIVLSAVALYKGARIWSWLGDRVKEKRSLVLAQELVLQERKKDNPFNGYHMSTDGADRSNGDAHGAGSGGGALAGGGSRRRRKSKPSISDTSGISRSSLNISPLSRTTPLPSAPPPSSPSSFACSPVPALAGSSSSVPQSAHVPREMDDADADERQFTLVAPGGSRKPQPGPSSTKARGRGRPSVEQPIVASSSAPVEHATPSSPQTTTSSSRKARKQQAKGKNSSPSALPASSDLPTSGQALVSSGQVPSLCRKELSPPSSVSSLALSSSSSSSQAEGASSDTTQATTLASSTLSLGFDFPPFTSTSGAESTSFPTAVDSGSSSDQALRKELSATLKLLRASEIVLDTSQSQLSTANARLSTSEASLTAAKSEIIELKEALDAARKLGEERSVVCEENRVEGEKLRKEIKQKEQEVKRDVEGRNKREREANGLRRELERWKEDGRKWEQYEREFKRRETEVRPFLKSSAL